MRLLDTIQCWLCTSLRLGPTLFLVLASDLNTLSWNNELINFAHDLTVLVPENSDVNVTIEFNHIQDWAKYNSIIIICKLNFGKTNEVVFIVESYLPHSSPIFTVRHVMQRTLLLSQFCLSVCLSVCPSVRRVYCDKTK